MSPEKILEQPRPPKGEAPIKKMFGQVAERYDLANRILSLGRDPFWRSALARRLKIVEKPGRLLDLAAGTGDQIVAAKRARPDLSVTGLDLSPDMIELAGPKLDRLPAPRPEMLVGDALQPPFEDNSFDSVSISFGLRNISARAALYGQARRLLKPGGRFLVLEMYHDRQAFWAPVVNFYLRQVVPFLGGRLISRQREAYRYLSSSILAFPPPQTLIEEMATAGFEKTGFITYTFGTVMLVWGDKAETGAGKKTG